MNLEQDINKAHDQGLMAAHNGVSFRDCPYTFKNAGCENVALYKALAYDRLRDAWFASWRRATVKVAR